MRTRLVALCAALLPTVAVAQPVPDAADPNESYAPLPTCAEPAQAQVAPDPTQLVTPPPARATVVSTDPAYDTVEDSWDAPMFTSGALLFTSAYGASVVAAAASSQEDLDRGSRQLYIPVAGPWLALRDRGGCPITQRSCDNETSIKVMLVADGIVQGAGALTMLAGLLSPTTHDVPAEQTAKLDKKVHITPTAVGTRGSGVTVFGRF